MLRRLFENLVLPAAGKGFAALWLRHHRVREHRAIVWFARTWFDFLARRYESIARRIAAGRYDGALVSALDVIKQSRAMEKAVAADGGRERILDVCTGTGIVARYLADSYPRAYIVCTDISRRMLEEIRNRWEASKHSGPHLVQADATRLSFRTGIFNLVILQNAPPYIEELVRVAASGATVVLVYTFDAVVPERYETELLARGRRAGLSGVRVGRIDGGAFIIGTKGMN
jgi:ubiquinone/menaquinone biosynthesis C-methylase UbiE